MIDEAQALKLAENFLQKQDSRGHTYRISGVRSNEKRPGVYGVIFDVYTPENSLLDGPLVMLVDKRTGETYPL